MQGSVDSKCKQNYEASSYSPSANAYMRANIKAEMNQAMLEELESLRNENFNLKLERYCFSKLCNTQRSNDLLDTPVCEAHVITTLRKDLKLKTEQMMQAASTIEMQNKMIKDCFAEKEAKFAELQSNKEKLKQTSDELEMAKARIEILKSGLKMTQDTVSSCEAKIKKLTDKNSILIDNVEIYSNDNLKTKTLLDTQKRLLIHFMARDQGLFKNQILNSTESMKTQVKEGDRNRTLTKSRMWIRKLESWNLFSAVNIKLNSLMETFLKTFLKSSLCRSNNLLCNSSLASSIKNGKTSGYKSIGGIFDALRNTFTKFKNRLSEAVRL